MSPTTIDMEAEEQTEEQKQGGLRTRLGSLVHEALWLS